MDVISGRGGEELRSIGVARTVCARQEADSSPRVSPCGAEVDASSLADSEITFWAAVDGVGEAVRLLSFGRSFGGGTAPPCVEDPGAGAWKRESPGTVLRVERVASVSLLAG